jgi:hypothetical protein
MLTTFAREQLHVSFDWLPSMLLENFRLWAENIVNSRPRQIRGMRPDEIAVRTLPKGRGPRETLERDVLWFCRARIKHPPDPIALLPTSTPARNSGIPRRIRSSQRRSTASRPGSPASSSCAHRHSEKSTSY